MIKFKIYLKNLRTVWNLMLKGLLLSSLVKNDAQKIFLTTSRLFAAKYSLINRMLFEAIGVINLNEIKNQAEIKKNYQDG